MKQWQTTITRLIKESARRAVDRMGGISRIAQNSTNPAPPNRQMQQQQQSQPYGQPQYSYTSSTNGRSVRSGYGMDEPDSSSSLISSYGGGPNGYPPHDGFDLEPDEDDFEDYPVYSSSGRGTPVGSRRNNAMSTLPAVKMG